jgi:ATP-dependent RNA helicase RhlE
LTQFNELGLADPILRALEDAGYTQPTPIQREVIPALLEGRDVMGIAQTGTGKTAAFVLPILHRLAEFRKRPAPKTCRALILSPTRELSAQIRDNLQNYSSHMRLSSALVVGGLKAGPQVKMLARGVDVVVATPGRLLDLVRSGALRLDEVQTLVLDEADQMLDLGFIPAIRDIVSRLPKERQTALLSATMPKPIKALAHDLLTDPKQISVAPASRPIERIEQSVVLMPRESKRDLLLELMSDRSVERSIVFTRTKRGADRVNKHLVQFGLKSAAIHGDKSQGQRVKALDGFKAGSVKILVATDIAARGIDVDDVSHVVNFELPNIPESYVHRIGRTARAGKTGVAVSLCDPTEYEYLCDIEKLTGVEIDRTLMGEEAVFFAEASAVKPAKKKRSRGRGRPASGGQPGGQRQARQGGRPGARADAQRGEGQRGEAGGKPRRQRRRNGQNHRGQQGSGGVHAQA